MAAGSGGMEPCGLNDALALRIPAVVNVRSVRSPSTVEETMTPGAESIDGRVSIVSHRGGYIVLHEPVTVDQDAHSDLN